MSAFDYDVLIIGSGFGGSVSAFRAAEKGYKVGVVEAGRRWTDDSVPKSSWDLKDYVWMPGLELYGMQRIELLDDVSIMCGAGVGGGSQVYANTLYVPPAPFFQAPEWKDITAWDEELAPFIDQAKRMLGVVRDPYMSNDTDRILQKTVKSEGRSSSYNRAPVGVYFGEPDVEVDDPYFGGVGPSRRGCINCGQCSTGCGFNAKNKLDANYLYLAEALGAQVHDMSEAYEITPLDGGGFEVKARHPGWVQRGIDFGHTTFRTMELVISAHAYGSSKLLLHMQAKGNLDRLSSQLGQRARTNSEMLLGLTIPYDTWKEDPERFHFSPGSVMITSGVWPDSATSIEPNFFGVGSDAMGMILNWHQEGHQEHPLEDLIKEAIEHPSKVFGSFDVRNWSERTTALLCMQTKDNFLDLRWEDGLLRSKEGPGDAVRVHIPEVEAFADKVAKRLDAKEEALVFEHIRMAASAHFIGGITIGETADTGAVDPYQRAFGYEGLHVIDGSVMPANPGVNPSLMITALAERAMSFWPNKGDDDTRPTIGSGYKRLGPVMPHRPYVPAGAPGELRLDATVKDTIPDYPYDV
ncbi:MAG: GMC oxidoreductase [Acidimicrobiales bacterium]